MTQAIAPPRPRPTAKFAKIYAGTWTLLAALALAYMIALAVQPGIVADWTPGRAEPDVPEVQSSVARFATDIGGLKQAVGEIQRDVSSLRTAVMSTSARDKDLSERLAVIEERAKPQITAEFVVPKVAVQKAAEPRAPKALEKAAAPQPAAKAVPAAPAAEPVATAAPESTPAAPRVTVLNAPAAPANSIATGSILPPPAHGLPAPPAVTTPAAFGPGAIRTPAPAQPVAVELASGPSLDALRLNWSLLSERHSASLKHLEARYTNAGEGQPYQLVAGPIATPDEAAKVCAQLKAKRVACRVTGFGGNAL